MHSGLLTALLEVYINPDFSLCPNEQDYFVRHGLIEYNEDLKRMHTTKRADKFINMLTETPLPDQCWVDPREQVKHYLGQAAGCGYSSISSHAKIYAEY